MAGIAGAVHQGNGTAAVAIHHGLTNLGCQAGAELQRFHLLAIGCQATLHLNRPDRQRLGAFNAEGKDIGPVLITDGGEVGQAPVDQQQHGLAPVLNQGIGGHGGAQAHPINPTLGYGLAWRDSQDGSDRRNGRIPQAARLHGKHLAHHKLAGWGAAHHIGEGATPIQPKTPATALLTGNFQIGGARQRLGP